MPDSGRLPSAAVLDAFALDGPPVPLPGGQGCSVRVGGVVLKPVDDLDEAVWLAELPGRVVQDGFRFPRPLRAGDGSWVVDGWSATGFVVGAPGPARHLDELLAVADALAHALRAEPEPAFARRRSDPWAVADRVAWLEQQADPPAAVAPLLRQLQAAVRPQQAERRQLLHCDLAGNVLFSAGQPPAVLDLSVCWRPPSYALAVAVVDSVLWWGAGLDALRLHGRPAARRQLPRALLFRLAVLAEFAAHDPAALGELPRFDEVAAAVGP